MRPDTVKQMLSVYEIESECIRKMQEYFDEDSYGKAVELLKTAERIGCTGCGHSGILCQHFAHLMCCIDRPAVQGSFRRVMSVCSHPGEGKPKNFCPSWISAKPKAFM